VFTCSLFGSKGVTGAEIHRKLSAQYGDSVLPQLIVYEWIEMFQNGRTNVTEAEQSRRSSTSTT
jgi:hypothetical protein